MELLLLLSPLFWLRFDQILWIIVSKWFLTISIRYCTLFVSRHGMECLAGIEILVSPLVGMFPSSKYKSFH